MSGLQPFISYYGGKWRSAPRYPSPSHHRIVEPFAGAAGYSVRHHRHDVVLVEKNPIVAGLWRWLIAAGPDQVRRLPLLPLDGSRTLDDFDLEPAERALIGFWLNKGAVHPGRSPSSWMRSGIRPNSYWGETIRERVASQVEAISHWTVVEGDYSDVETREATWFVDPPYEQAGSLYSFSSKHIDFAELASWCRTRPGQVLVCENRGADWLPFVPFLNAKATPGSRGRSYSAEALWSNDPADMVVSYLPTGHPRPRTADRGATAVDVSHALPLFAPRRIA